LAKGAGVTGPTDKRVQPFVKPPWERDLVQKWAGRYHVEQKGKSTKKSRHATHMVTRREDAEDLAVLAIYTDGSRREVSTARAVPRAGSVRINLAGGKSIRTGRPVPGRVRMKVVKEEKTGAGYVIYHGGEEVVNGKIGLGIKSNVWDGELCAIAAAARKAEDYIKENPGVTSWHFYLDNDAAVGKIGDKGGDAGQSFSLSFSSSVDRFLFASQAHTVRVGWIPGHTGIPGNTRADALANKAVTEPSIVASTITWAKGEATSKATNAWTQEWKDLDRTRAWWGEALGKPPSTKIAKFHKDFKGPCNLQCCVVQVVLGHCFVGEYYSRFNVNAGHIGCECGAADGSLDHVLFDCFAWRWAREALYECFRLPTRKKIFGSDWGLEALADFLHRCKAFHKRLVRRVFATPEGNGGGV
jgi:ribonuclease HI